MRNKNKPFDEGKFYMGRNAGRVDRMKKAKQTQIFRFDADKIEIWMHEPKVIMEMKMQYNALVDCKRMTLLGGFGDLLKGMTE